MTNRQVVGKMRQPRTAILVLCAFAIVISLAGLLAQQIQPWRYAKAMSCLIRDQSTQAYRNICDFPINFGYKVDQAKWPETQSFPFETLQPNQSTITWRRASADVPAGQKFWYFACKAPHVPGMVYSQSNRAITRVGCRRAMDPAGSKRALTDQSHQFIAEQL